MFSSSRHLDLQHTHPKLDKRLSQHQQKWQPNVFMLFYVVFQWAPGYSQLTMGPIGHDFCQAMRAILLLPWESWRDGMVGPRLRTRKSPVLGLKFGDLMFGSPTYIPIFFFGGPLLRQEWKCVRGSSLDINRVGIWWHGGYLWALNFKHLQTTRWYPGDEVLKASRLTPSFPVHVLTSPRNWFDVTAAEWRWKQSGSAEVDETQTL